MSQFWQRFVRFIGDDPEVAVTGLLLGLFGAIASIGLIVYWFSVRRFGVAAGVTAALGIVVSVCIRDYRRRRWSFLSGLLITIWLLLSAGAVGYELWIMYDS